MGGSTVDEEATSHACNRLAISKILRSSNKAKSLHHCGIRIPPGLREGQKSQQLNVAINRRY